MYVLYCTQLITAEEMCDPRIDELSIMTYLSQFPYAKLNEESVVQVQEVAPGSSRH